MILKYIVKWQYGNNEQSVKMTPVDILYNEKEFATTTYEKILESLKWAEKKETVKDLTILAIFSI